MEESVKSFSLFNLVLLILGDSSIFFFQLGRGLLKMTSYEFNSRFLGKKHDIREKFPAITIMNLYYK